MEDFVSFELAKKLKEKGFNWTCSHYYRTKSKDLFMIFHREDWSNIEERINAPTRSQVLKWLRDKFFLHISQKPYPCEDGLMWMYEIRKFDKHIVFVIANKTGFVEEEEASLAGIEYVIKNLI